VRWTRRGWIIGTAIAVLLPALAGCSNDPEVEKPAIPASFYVHGDLRLSGSRNVTGDLSNCAGVGPYADIYKGAVVVVTNQNGKPISRGAVTASVGTNYYQNVLDECAFNISVLNVPRVKRGYFIVLARQPAHWIPLSSMVVFNGLVRFDLNPPTVRPGAAPVG
jgi:hypothetical protein